MTIDEIIAVLQAEKAGKAEWRCKGDGQAWCPWIFDSTPFIDTEKFDYRVKPEPREFWLISTGSDLRHQHFISANADERDQSGIIHVREVLE